MSKKDYFKEYVDDNKKDTKLVWSNIAGEIDKTI